MAADPTIKFVSATKDATSTLIMALLENTSRGMVQMRASLTPTCTTITVLNCTTTINSTTVTTTASFGTVVIGLKVTGTGIAAGTYVTAIASATSLTINKNATATASGTTLIFGPEDVRMTTDWCVELSHNIYIPEMYRMVNNYEPVTTTANTACIRAHTCSSGEDCDNLACSIWNSSYSSGVSNIPIENAFGNVPAAVSSLTLTPGDKTISCSWGDAGQTTSVWCYEITLDQGATRLVSGPRVKNTMVITNLTNGTAYTVSVRARSFDGYQGLWTVRTETPVAACVPPECDIEIV